MISAPSRTTVLALCAALIPLVYWPDLFEFALLPRLFLLQVLLLVGLGGWAISLRKYSSLTKHPLVLPALCYVGLSIASVFWATNPVEGLVQAGRLFTFLVLMRIAATLPSPAIRTVWAVSAATGAAASCIGIAQYFGWAFSWVPTVGNPSATFGYRNFAASYLVASIPPVITFAWASASRNGLIAWATSATLMTLFLVYTRTRGAWLGLGLSLFVGALILLWFRLRHNIGPTQTPGARRRMLTIACCLLILAGGATLSHRMQQEGKFRFDERKTDTLTALEAAFSSADARGRLTLWQHTLEMIRDHPFLGVGLGSWQVAYPLYDRGDWITANAAPQRPHNDLLWILSEIGLLGFACYAWLLFVFFRTTWRALRTAQWTPDTVRAFGIALGILALIGHSCFSFPKERIAPSFIFWLGLGTAPVLLGTVHKQRRATPRLLFPALGLAVLLLCLALYTTYRQIRFDAPYLQAVIAWRQQAWPRVAQATQEALEWGSFNHRALLLQGRALDAQGHSEDAVQAYHKAFRYQPNDGHAALAAAYENLGQYDLAAQQYEIEHRLFPRSPDAAQGLAYNLLQLGRWDEAEQAYRKALALTPDAPDLYHSLGNALQANNHFEAAATAYSQALHFAPNDPVVSNNLGAVLVRLGRLDDAEQAYLEALSLRPTYARVHHNLGDLYAAKLDTHRAVSAYETFLRTWQGDERFIELTRQKLRNLKGIP
ncbi:MAG: tetratricopeptide repeat protein [bacterium]|nr:tetratricopeptide repeat protein [bacterium]